MLTTKGVRWKVLSHYEPFLFRFLSSIVGGENILNDVMMLFQLKTPIPSFTLSKGGQEAYCSPKAVTSHGRLSQTQSMSYKEH